MFKSKGGIFYEQKNNKGYIDLKGKKVFVRCDFNVPIGCENGNITDNTRIVVALPTIKYLLEQKL